MVSIALAAFGLRPHTPTTRFAWRVGVGVFLLNTAALSGQSLPIQSVLGAVAVSGCSATPNVSLPSASPPTTSESLRALISRAQDAALQGDHVAARDAYARAAATAPGEPRLLYYLGREQEELRDAKGAVQSFCRYLAMTAAAPDADEVRGRITRLTPVDEIARQDNAQVLFRSGVVLLQRGDYHAADSILTVTTRLLPNAPAPLYNRALARAAQGQVDSARADFQQYIALTPRGSDHAAIDEALDAMPRHTYDPGNAFAVGLLFPGLGQVRTRRPVLGVVALGAFTGAMVLALQWKREYELVIRRDAQGNPVADSVRVTTHPTAIPGYPLAAAVWLGAALESYAYARRSRSRYARIISRGNDGLPRVVVVPLSGDRTGLGLGITWK